MKRLLLALLLTSLALSSVSTASAQEINSKIEEKTSTNSKISDGIYSFTDSEDLSIAYLEDSVYLRDTKKSSTQKWVVVQVEKGIYTINNLNSGLYLEISNTKKVSKATVSLGAYSGEEGQLWKLKKDKKGLYSIHPAADSNYSLVTDWKEDPVLEKTDDVQKFTMTYQRDILEKDEISSSIDTIQIDEESDDNGNFTVVIENPESNAYVSGAYFEVTPKKDSKNTQTFYQARGEDGNITFKVHSRDFNYVLGEYEVTAKLYLDGQHESLIGTFSSTVNDPFPILKENVEKYLREHVPVYIEDWQFYLRDVTSGKVLDINAHQAQAASMIKMFVAGEAFDEYERLCKDYTKEYIDYNLEQVITVSSNDAWMRLIECIGDGNYYTGHQIVQDWAQEHGYTSVITQYENSQNFVSSEDTSKFFQDCYEGKLAHSDELIDFFKHQQYTHKIPQGVPTGVVTGNKTGDLNTTENDTCIVYAPRGTYILCMMSTGLGDTYRARCAIRAVSKMVYEFLNE